MKLVRMSQKFKLEINDSNALKGVALLLLLFHHLFYIQNGRYDDVTLHIGGGEVLN